jgi:cobalt-zinc-cadmium efflux system outer membrane protein
MRPFAHGVKYSVATAVLAAAGCATPPTHPVLKPITHAQRPPERLPPVIQQAQATVPTPTPAPTSLNALLESAYATNPRLTRANALVEAARGRFLQAGLPPNPVYTFSADELGDRNGPIGILSPQISQEFVLGGKLSLGQAVAAKEVDQATLTVLAERYAIAGRVRATACELAALRQRVEILAEVVAIAEKLVEQATKAEKGPNTPLTRGDVLPLELELERFRSEKQAVERELPAVERRLAAALGDARMPIGSLSLDLSAPLPEYDLDQVREQVMAYHPEARVAAVAVEKARAAVHRAEVEVIPNVTASVGYVRQNQNRSNDWSVGVSVPLVLRNRNQGNIRAAQAEVVAATHDVTRIQNTLAERVAVAYRTYALAKKRAEQYQASILPKVEEIYGFVKSQFEKGVVEYLRVLQAQRAVAEARLESNLALSEAWQAAGELSGLLLEENWPPAPSTVPSKLP